MKLKRILTLALALFTCSSVLMACGKTDNTEPEQTTEASITTVETQENIEYDENGYQMDKLGEMNFDAKEINISGWSKSQSVKWDFDIASLTNADTVSAAAYLKNRQVESRLNVKLAYEITDGWTGPGGTAGQAQLTRVQAAAGTDEIDLIATYSWNPCTFMTQGYIVDINNMPHVDLNAPWWNQSLIEKSSILGKVYAVTGDIAPTLISSTYAVFFNKNMISDYHLDDPYKLYESGDWTLDKMIEMSNAVASDVGEVGTKEKGDTFGLVTFATATDAFYHGCGMVLTENAADGTILLSDDFGSSKVHDLLVKLVNFDKTSACFITVKSKSSGDDWRQAIWTSGNALFLLDEFSRVGEWMDSNASNFGILPMPKYDKTQSEYYTLSGNFHTMYCVPKALGGNEAVGATLECLASESYRRVSPAYYEDLIQSRYSATVTEAIMFDKVRESVVIDSGRIFNQHIGWKIAQQFRINLAASDTNWSSAYQALEPTLQTNITTLNQMASIAQ